MDFKIQILLLSLKKFKKDSIVSFSIVLKDEIFLNDLIADCKKKNDFNVNLQCIGKLIWILKCDKYLYINNKDHYFTESLLKKHVKEIDLRKRTIYHDCQLFQFLFLSIYI